MQRNIITELGKLHEGDRFAYLKRVDPWIVMDTRGTKVAVNQLDPDGSRIHKYDDFKSPGIQVRFLRHTKPLPQEECIVNDLQPGDVFFENSNVVREWKVIKQDYPKILAACLTSQNEVELFPWNTWVTFVRKNSNS
jgi:hypothetical protein